MIKSKTTVITVASTKGGVGKSTIAINLGLELRRQGYSCLLMDADDQASIDSFIAKRNAYLEKAGIDPDHDIEHVIQRNSIPKYVGQIINQERFDYVIIDTTGKKSETFLMASVCSHIIISPTSASEVDSDELESMDTLMESANAMREGLGLDPIKALVFFNKVDARSFSTLYMPSRRKVIDNIENKYSHLTLAKSYLGFYGVYQSCFSKGCGITETTSKYRGQFQTLANEIIEQD